MKWKLAAIMFPAIFISSSFGTISVEIYFSDCNTLLPFEPNTVYSYPDIMLGTQLEIFILSDIALNWSGSFALVDANMDYGILSARDYNVITHDWQGSRFPAAGKEAVVWNWEESPAIYGFELHTGSTQILPGKWFVLDYVPTKLGICRIGFYDHTVHWYVPVYYLTFSQVRSRDFNNDSKVDFTDFSHFSQHWLSSSHNESMLFHGMDLDSDNDVDGNDLSLFIEFWLAGTK